ncbi:hypothetical protein Tco_0942588 [Tanacetum coccineum]
MQVPNPSRGTLGVVAGSPSRFAPTPTGQQVNPGSLPTVSVTGTNYVASSPSPAGSGGTSVFRDVRLPRHSHNDNAKRRKLTMLGEG